MKFYRLCAEQAHASWLASRLTPLVCTIGNFDGVHLGHQALVSQVLAAAKKQQAASAVMLFEPQPMEYLRPAQAPVRLMSWREKLHHLSALGVEVVLALRFNQALSQLSPQDFVAQVLVQACRVRHVVVGDDFRFGRQRQGTVADMVRFGQQAGGQSEGLTVEQAQTRLWQGERVSSTRIRAALASGELEAVRAMLGRAFEMAGKVVYGDQLGRTIGFPTANLKISQPSLPCRGVYAVTVSGEGLADYPAVANLGVRPTVDGARARCEVHLLGFDGQLYGKRLRLRFCEKLRDEQRFASMTALKAAIAQDVRQAKQFFEA